jgi:uncharacterized protein YbaP (TraB family)
MTLARALRLVFFALLAAPLAAQAAPACTGVDLIQKLKRTDKAAYAAFEAEAAKTPAGEGLLWRIDKPGVAPSHLFGTFHASDPRLIAVVNKAQPLIKRASVVATELGDMSAPAKALAMAGSLFSGVGAENRTLSLVDGEDKRATLVRLAAERGLDRDTLDKMAPWMLVGLFALPVCELGRKDREIVDEKVMETARAAKVEIEALESVEEQLDAIKSIDKKLIGGYLGVIAERPALIDDGFATMVSLYASSRIGAVEAAMKHGLKLTARQSLLSEDVSKRLVIDRNKTMARRASPLLEKGNAFVAVGAMHLIGAEGVVELLRKDGWRATKLW